MRDALGDALEGLPVPRQKVLLLAKQVLVDPESDTLLLVVERELDVFALEVGDEED